MGRFRSIISHTTPAQFEIKAAVVFTVATGAWTALALSLL